MSTFTEWITTLFGRFDLSEGLLVNKWTQALLVLIISLTFSRLLQNFVQRRLSHDEQKDEAAIKTYKNMARLVVMVPGILLTIHVLGLSMSSLFTTSGLFAVAMAFAMKNISENYISGMLIRLDRSIKPGDVLETNGIMIKVKSIGFRETIVRSKDEMDILIPNSHLIQQEVANYTLQDSLCRVSTMLGVTYSSNPEKVRETLENICNKLEESSDQHAPQARLIDFGQSSVNYKVSIWIEDPWKSGSVKSQLNEAIWLGLNEAGIKFAYLQMDVHLDTKIKHEEVIGPEQLKKTGT